MKSITNYLLGLLLGLTTIACSGKNEAPASKPESKDASTVKPESKEDSATADTKFAAMENPIPASMGESCNDVFDKDDMEKTLKAGDPYGGIKTYISIGIDAKHTFAMTMMNYAGKLGLMVMLVHKNEVCIKGKEEQAEAAIKFADGSYYKLKAVNVANCGTAESVNDSTGAVAIFDVPLNSTFFKKALHDEIKYIGVETKAGILISKFVTTDGPQDFRNGFRCAFDVFENKPNLDDESKLINNRAVLKKDQSK